jgi:iron complex outermembrane receptor protein
MVFSTVRGACALFSGVSVLALAGPGLAQVAAGESPAAVPEITVTAQRRTENLQKVPIAVSVLRQDDLNNFQAGGADTLLSLSGRVPDLYVEGTTGRIFPRFYIRGLGNIDFYLGASQPVSIIQDDVALEHVVLKSNPVFDTQQVEVLKGPQGSLFGRNTTAGIIKFDSVKPSQTFAADGQFTYGEYNTVTFDGGVGGPLVKDLLSFRLSALYQHRDNWVSNTFAGPTDDGTQTPAKDAMGGFDERDVRLQLLYTPTPQLTILGSGHARDYSGTSTLFYRTALTRGSNSVPDSVRRDQVSYDEGANDPQAYRTYGGSVRAAYDFGPATLTSISAYETTSGYSRGDTDGGAAANYGGIGFGESQGRIRYLGQYTEELRLANNGAGRWKWQVGAIYFDQRDKTEFDQRAYFLTTAARNPNNWVLLRDVNTSWGLFGQTSYQLTDRLTLTVGARETNDTKRTALLKTANTAANVVTYKGRTYVSLSDTQPSWDVSALYTLTPEVDLYARIAHGFRGPTIQGRSAVFNSDFTTANSETNTSYEAGFKSRLFENRLRLNAAAFTYDVHNIQLNGNDANGNGVLFNARDARGYGAEADAELRPAPGLVLTGGLSLLHTEIRDDRVYAQVCALNGVVVCSVQNPTITVNGSVFAQINGNPLPNAPTYNLNFTARYDFPYQVGEGRFYVATDWNVQGKTSFVLYKTSEFTSEGNFEGGARFGYNTGRYDVSLFVRNLTNEKNLTGVIENYMAAVFNDPRVVGLSISAKFR